MKGFSLIEVLITLLLISIGILGMVALQTRTIQYTQDASQRNNAIILANDLVELMRAMPGDLPTSSGFYKAKDVAFPTAPELCTPLPDTASEQLACWAKKASTLLPVSGQDTDLLSSDFYICRTSTANSCTNTGTAIEIQIAWQAKAGECGDGSTVCYYRLRTQI
jgi:type IV pilus assembly protein PilV